MDVFNIVDMPQLGGARTDAIIGTMFRHFVVDSTTTPALIEPPEDASGGFTQVVMQVITPGKSVFIGDGDDVSFDYSSERRGLEIKNGAPFSVRAAFLPYIVSDTPVKVVVGIFR